MMLHQTSLKPDWINVVFWQYAVDSDSNCCYFYSLDPNTKIQRLRLIKLDKSYTDYSINLTNLYDEYKSLGGSDNINTISDFIARSVDYENNKFFLVASGIRTIAITIPGFSKLSVPMLSLNVHSSPGSPGFANRGT